LLWRLRRHQAEPSLFRRPNDVPHYSRLGLSFRDTGRGQEHDVGILQSRYKGSTTCRMAHSELALVLGRLRR
jgi:hypothetical protein